MSLIYYSRAEAEQRAQELLKTSGLNCEEFVAYCIYGDKNKHKGPNGWESWGSPASRKDAILILQCGHVGFISQGKVYYSEG